MDHRGAEVQQTEVLVQILLWLPPELGADPLGLPAAGIDREELHQAVKVPDLRRELRLAVQGQGDQPAEHVHIPQVLAPAVP